MHPAVVEGSLRLHDRFYAQLEDVIGGVVARHGFFLLLDLHSYNHRRGGPRAPVDDPEANPEINVGTATLDRLRFGRVADALVDALRGQEGPLGPLDVRENVRFQGGYLSRWANTRFLGAGCALALDVKKIYMDEWTGKIAPGLARMIGEALAAAIPAALAAFETVDRPVNPAA